MNNLIYNHPYTKTLKPLLHWIHYFKWTFYSFLTRLKNNENPGEDSINFELLKCASQETVIRFLGFLNNMGWRRRPIKPPKSNYNSNAQERKYERLWKFIEWKKWLNSCYRIYANVIKIHCTLITKINQLKNRTDSENYVLVFMTILH